MLIFILARYLISLLLISLLFFIWLITVMNRISFHMKLSVVSACVSWCRPQRGSSTPTSTWSTSGASDWRRWTRATTTSTIRSEHEPRVQSHGLEFNLFFFFHRAAITGRPGCCSGAQWFDTYLQFKVFCDELNTKNVGNKYILKVYRRLA